MRAKDREETGSMTMKNGLIFDIKRFAVHDGQGLRTTLFLKGCPLRCPWCQNPEGLTAKPVLWYSPTDCLHCGSCAAVCGQGALTAGPERIHVDRDRCVLCGRCADACPGAALKIRGRTVSSAEAAEMLLRDKVFFGDSGGVTLSGGEVLMQWEFAAEVLRLVKEEGVDTAIETCLLAPQEAVEAMLACTDHFIVDIKILDGEEHKRMIGADNRQILSNFQWLYAHGADLLVRTPLIPGFTATEKNIRDIARYVAATDPDLKYELLNYNPLCLSKYAALEWDYPVDEKKPLATEQMNRFYQILEEEGIKNILRS